MSNTGKIILWVVIAVVVIGGIWWLVAGQSNVATAPSNTASGTAGSPESATTTASTTVSASYPQGNSNQAIDQSMTNLNTQMNGLTSDNASVTQSLNDQPVTQVQQ